MKNSKRKQLTVKKKKRPLLKAFRDDVIGVFYPLWGTTKELKNKIEGRITRELKAELEALENELDEKDIELVIKDTDIKRLEKLLVEKDQEVRAMMDKVERMIDKLNSNTKKD